MPKEKTKILSSHINKPEPNPLFKAWLQGYRLGLLRARDDFSLSAQMLEAQIEVVDRELRDQK